MEDLNRVNLEGGGGGERERVVLLPPERASLPGASVPSRISLIMFLADNKQRAEGLSNLILVGTIIMLVALVRHVFRYLLH